MKTGQIVAVIDIGSTKVACCIASVLDDGQFNIISAGHCACFGVRAGTIVDVELVSKSIANAVEMAEKASNLRLKSVYVNVSGRYVTSTIMSASITVGGRIIREQDISSLLSLCRDRDQNKETIHIIPVMFNVDELKGIKEPLGMFANVLTVKANVVSVSKTQLNNIISCLAKCHLDVIGFIHSGYASSLCMLDDELSAENQIVIDFGGGASSINFVYKGIFCGSEIVPLGGRNITKDIASCLKISTVNAERLKTLHGSAFVSHDDNKSMIMAPVIEEDGLTNLQQLPRSSLNQIIQSRVEEILSLIKKKIEQSAFGENFAKHVLITGGGSLLVGMREFASEMLKKNVKTRKIDDYLDNSGIQINNEFATCLGMIRFVMLADSGNSLSKNDGCPEKQESFFRKTIQWLKNSL